MFRQHTSRGIHELSPQRRLAGSGPCCRGEPLEQPLGSRHRAVERYESTKSACDDGWEPVWKCSPWATDGCCGGLTLQNAWFDSRSFAGNYRGLINFDGSIRSGRSSGPLGLSWSFRVVVFSNKVEPAPLVWEEARLAVRVQDVPWVHLSQIRSHALGALSLSDVPLTYTTDVVHPFSVLGSGSLSGVMSSARNPVQVSWQAVLSKPDRHRKPQARRGRCLGLWRLLPKLGVSGCLWAPFQDTCLSSQDFKENKIDYSVVKYSSC